MKVKYLKKATSGTAFFPKKARKPRPINLAEIFYPPGGIKPIIKLKCVDLNKYSALKLKKWISKYLAWRKYLESGDK